MISNEIILSSKLREWFHSRETCRKPHGYLLSLAMLFSVKHFLPHAMWPVSCVTGREFSTAKFRCGFARKAI